MEYPLRPPLFNLSIFPEDFHGSKWQNELRAMEAEVCLLYKNFTTNFSIL